MDIYRINFTVLQQEILRILFVKVGMTFNARRLAKALKVSPTAIAKSLKSLEHERLIKVERESGRLLITLNRENPAVFYLKRVENLRLVYESGLADYLSEKFPGTTIVLFGSYSFGEDIIGSDIDIAVIGEKEGAVETARFSKLLERRISVQFFDSLGQVHKNLRENIMNGIVLKGGIII